MSRPKPSQQPIQVPFRCPPALHARLKIYAEVRGIPVNSAVLEFVDRGLKERKL